MRRPNPLEAHSSSSPKPQSKFKILFKLYRKACVIPRNWPVALQRGFCAESTVFIRHRYVIIIHKSTLAHACPQLKHQREKALYTRRELTDGSCALSTELTRNTALCCMAWLLATASLQLHLGDDIHRLLNNAPPTLMGSAVTVGIFGLYSLS